jgi:hypothetical protein
LVLLAAAEVITALEYEYVLVELECEQYVLIELECEECSVEESCLSTFRMPVCTSASLGQYFVEELECEYVMVAFCVVVVVVFAVVELVILPVQVRVLKVVGLVVDAEASVVEV